MDLSRDQIVRPKLLGETCWIALKNDEDQEQAKIRVDYLTDQEDGEHRRLNRKQLFRMLEEGDEHPDVFYLNRAVKEIVGITCEGKPVSVGMIMKINGDEITLTPSRILRAAQLFDLAFMKVRSLLMYSDFDKKKISSSPNSSSEARDSTQASPSSEERPRSSTDGDPSKTTEH